MGYNKQNLTCAKKIDLLVLDAILFMEVYKAMKDICLLRHSIDSLRQAEELRVKLAEEEAEK